MRILLRWNLTLCCLNHSLSKFIFIFICILPIFRNLLFFTVINVLYCLHIFITDKFIMLPFFWRYYSLSSQYHSNCIALLILFISCMIFNIRNYTKTSLIKLIHIIIPMLWNCQFTMFQIIL